MYPIICIGVWPVSVINEHQIWVGNERPRVPQDNEAYRMLC